MLRVLRGLDDSLSLLSLRVRSMSLAIKAVIVIMVVGVFATIFFATFTAEAMVTLYTTPVADTPAAESVRTIQEYIFTYMNLYVTGDMDVFITISTLLMLGSIIFVPFSGYIIHGVISSSELTIVKNGDYYKIGDSIVFQLISSFTFIQLVGLTVITELLTLDTANPGLVTVFVWGLWFVLALGTTFIAWVVEYISRRFGKTLKFVMLAALLLFGASAAALDPNHGTTLFGASGHIFDFVQTLANTSDLNLFLTASVIVAVISLLLVFGISWIASAALQLPELPAVSKDRSKRAYRTNVRPTRFNITLLTVQLLRRYPTVVRPVLTSAVFSIIIAVVLGGNAAVTATLIVLPLAIGISFGANMFGIYGNSMNWVLSLHQVREKVVRVHAVIVACSILGLYALVYGIGVVSGRISFNDIAPTFPAMVSITAMVTLVSVWLSVTKPLPFSAKTRENVVSSPISLIGYVALYIVATSIFGNLPNLAQENTILAWQLSAIVTLLATAGIIAINHRWKTSDKWAMEVLTKTVNAG